uniref:Glutaredoxin domain-containing protein n=1 Tax=Cannabis sativa TaxID=3483 RepID=A0A803PA99_CANSA
MGSVVGTNKKSKEELQMALNKAKEIVSSHPVVVFSKTYCGYCERVKQLLTQVGASYKVFELDEESTYVIF